MAGGRSEWLASWPPGHRHTPAAQWSRDGRDKYYDAITPAERDALVEGTTTSSPSLTSCREVRQSGVPPGEDWFWRCRG